MFDYFRIFLINFLAIRHSVDRALPALSALLDLQFLQLSQLFQLSQFCHFFHSSDTLSSPSSSNFEIENWKSWESTYEKSERTNRVGRAGKGGRGREIGDPRELRELEEPCPQSVLLPKKHKMERAVSTLKSLATFAFDVTISPVHQAIFCFVISSYFHLIILSSVSLIASKFVSL